MKTLDENQLQGICRTCGRKYQCKDALRYLDMQGCNQYEELTNEEWFCNLSTEEKARFFDKICYSAWGDKSRFSDMADYTDWMEWLKQPHKE